MDSLAQMRARLEAHPAVVGLIEYGSRTIAGPAALQPRKSSDYDLIVILTELCSPVTSLHFDVGTTPVDLSLLSLQALSNLAAGDSFAAHVIATGRLIYDRDGAVAIEQQRLAEQSRDATSTALCAHDVAFIRHGHRHLLDKVRGRLTTAPLLCRVLLNSNLYWLLENYFRVRQRTFPGIQGALLALQQHEPQLYQQIEAFHATDQLAEQVRLTQAMTALVLAPIGGMWRQGEVLAFGDVARQDLRQQGKELFAHLFGDFR